MTSARKTKLLTKIVEFKSWLYLKSVLRFHIQQKLLGTIFIKPTQKIQLGAYLHLSSQAIHIANQIVEEKTHYVHFAPPCNTFSQARYPRMRIANFHFIKMIH